MLAPIEWLPEQPRPLMYDRASGVRDAFRSALSTGQRGTAGNGWSLSARTLARQTPPGIAARPLAVTRRHTVRFEIVWQINTDPDTIATFAQRVQDALADQHLS